MKTLNKEELIKQYIEKNDLKSNEMYYDYFDIAKYKLKDSKNPLDDFIKKFLNDYLLINFNFNTYEELINNIKDFNIGYLASDDIDIYYYSMMTSYEVFGAWLDLNERNELSIVETIQQAQNNAYYDLYEAIMNDLMKFLNKKNKSALKKSK